MPFKNFWSARIMNPKQFTNFAYTKNKLGDGIDVDWGIKDGKSHVQAIRFHKDKFPTKADVREWLSRHEKFKPISVESVELDEDAMPTITTADVATYAKRTLPMVSRGGDIPVKKKIDNLLSKRNK